MIKSRKQADIGNLMDLHCDPAQLPPQPPAPAWPVRPVYHGDGCPCESCCDIRASMDIYLRQRDLYSQNGFI